MTFREQQTELQTEQNAIRHKRKKIEKEIVLLTEERDLLAAREQCLCHILEFIKRYQSLTFGEIPNLIKDEA